MEITSAMVEAGAAELASHYVHSEHFSLGEIAKATFVAMMEAASHGQNASAVANHYLKEPNPCLVATVRRCFDEIRAAYRSDLA